MIKLATSLVYTMAATASLANGEMDVEQQADVVGSDVDAEGEEETDLYQMDQELQNAVHRSYSGEAGDGDGEGDGSASARQEHEPNGYMEDDTEGPRVENTTEPLQKASSSSDGEAETAGDADADSAFNGQSDGDNEHSESSTSEESDAAEEEWEAESNGREDGEVDNLNRANCM